MNERTVEMGNKFETAPKPSKRGQATRKYKREQLQKIEKMV